MENLKRNERDWAGQLISWLKEAISKGITSFEDATNDTSVKLSSGRTKFPDILLFSNKISGIIFNGWELKFPDTAVDDIVMLENALEKAQRLQSDSFVTWNGAEAIIWKINDGIYNRNNLSILKRYPKVSTINDRNDLAEPLKYAKHEPLLKQRALDILHDLDTLKRNGILKEAINISGNIIQSVKKAQGIIVPQFTDAIETAIGSNKEFRNKFNSWKIYESATLRILGSSSRRAESVNEKQVLATFAFYNLIGKTLFYLTLSENIPKELPQLSIDNPLDTRAQLYKYFDNAKSIDYQAVFMPYFTDELPFSQIVSKALFNLIQILTEFDFKILPSEVIGTILENLVPNEEKQKFGQYFTPEILANLVAYPAVSDRNAIVLDPTSGTGTFLNSFYQILSHFGNRNHQSKLCQIWGNDISHFPAILSVINLYKQDITQTENFPRVIRDDFFNLQVGKTVSFPDPLNHTHKISVAIPKFDGIASNFPFIQQEDIPNDKLSSFFKQEFEQSQAAFVREGNFHINERADYFAYCIYNSIRFIKAGGVISAITSNAWLGKEYGIQFKDFLLNNFHIKYIVRSNAEHWFSDSQVSTIFFVLEKIQSENPTKFVSLNFKLSTFFDKEDIANQICQIENLYSQIDNCDNEANKEWNKDKSFRCVYHYKDGMMDVVKVRKSILVDSLTTETNWSQYFTAPNPLQVFEQFIVPYTPKVFNVIRGERTGWNPMFVIPNRDVVNSGIDPSYLVPYIKSPTEFTKIEFSGNYNNYAFVCSKPLDKLDAGTHNWIKRFVNAKNKNGSLTIPEACAGHKPFWYTISPKSAHIVTAINPYERFFFTYSKNPFVIDQRLIAMQVNKAYDVELIAALLNSVYTFLTLEFVGTSRNLGALDLNANYLKHLRLLNPDLISDSNKAEIIKAFAPLKNRTIETVFEEIKKEDRVNFDKSILRAYGIDESILPSLYEMLAESVYERTSLKYK